MAAVIGIDPVCGIKARDAAPPRPAVVRRLANPVHKLCTAATAE
jgi:hypothetical protein